MSAFNNKMRIEGFESLVQAVNALTPTTAESIGEIIYNQTAAEASAGVTPTAYRYPPGDVRRYGAVGNGATNDAAAFQTAFNLSIDCYIPAGTFAINTPVVSNTVPRIYGAGSSVSLLTTTLTSGNVLEFNNAVGSFDEGFVMQGFRLTGPGSGSAVGIKVEGAVYVNSIMRDVLVKSMGSHGLYFDDCLTMKIERVRAQVNGGTGILIDKSNGFVLVGCSAESNGAHGIYFNDGGVAFNENFGASVVACHSETNGVATGGHALYINGHYGVQVLGGWYQCESTAAANANACIRLEDAQHCRIVGPLLNTGGTITNLIGLDIVDSLFNDANIYAYGFASGRDWLCNAAGNRNRITGTSSQGQGALSYTDSSTIGNVRENYCGSGGSYGNEVFANYHSFLNAAGTEHVLIDSVGRLYAKTRFGLPVLASAPSSPQTGETYFDDTTNKVRTWDGSAWQDHF